MCWQVGGHNHSLQGHSFLCCFSHYSMVMGSGKLYGNISRADIVSAPQRHPPDLLSSTSLTWDTLTGSIDLILIFLSLILAHGMPVSRPLSVLTPARSGPDAVGSSSSSWVLTMKLSPASSLALSLPMVCQHQGLPMVQYHGPSFAHWVQNLQDGAHQGRAWPSLGYPMVLWTYAAWGFSWSSWLQSSGWDHFLRSAWICTLLTEKLHEWLEREGLLLSKCCLQHPAAVWTGWRLPTLWEMGTCLGTHHTIMVLEDNGIACARVVESPQLGLCHWYAWDRHELSECPSNISLGAQYPKLQKE